MNFPIKVISVLVVVLSFVFPITHTYAQEEDSTKVPANKPLISHGDKGFEFTSMDGNYLMQIQFRGQFRLAYPTDSDPIDLSDFQEEQLYMRVNRARMKVGAMLLIPH